MPKPSCIENHEQMENLSPSHSRAVFRRLNISWYQRAQANIARTSVQATLGLNPRLTTAPASSATVTTVSTDWINVSSDIIPNSGDYTDNYVIATPAAPYTGSTLYAAWSDGRRGLPQPFEAKATISP
jgi:hypothetical protein